MAAYLMSHPADYIVRPYIMVFSLYNQLLSSLLYRNLDQSNSMFAAALPIV